ncbi:MAG: CHAT domain-containing protein [Rhodothermales bacterium]|nr:CHAT domain-containing protein [Rhodothermales bacterium]
MADCTERFLKPTEQTELQEKAEPKDIRILFVSANPSSTQKLDLADELRQFQHSLRGHKVKLWLLPAAQPDDLRMAIKSKKIDVVHFSGHAKDSGILMRDEEGIEVEVPKDELVELFKDKNIKLVVLNACETSEIADGIKESVETVIGTTEKVKEPVARKLSKNFYAALGQGESIGAAYAEAYGILEADDERVLAKNPKAKKRNVYMAHGKSNEEPLLPADKPKDADVELEGSEPFDRYYYADYLDKQISSYRLYRRANLVALSFLVAIGFAFIVWMWERDMVAALEAAELKASVLRDAGFFTAADAALDGAGEQGFWSWAKDQLSALFTESRGETPLLDWLAAVGQAIPTFIATMQARWCVHGTEKIRQLVALKELVRNSENLTQDLRIRLHKIMDQCLKNEEGPNILFTFFGSMYERLNIFFRRLIGK